MRRRDFIKRGALFVPATFGIFVPRLHSAPPLFLAQNAGASAAATRPLDGYTSSLAASWSIRRRLLTSYTGALIRVERSSDNTQSDIGYDGSGNLDQSALTTFTGAGSGYIAKFYDQSGNGRDAAQATYSAMPRIVSSGVVDTMDSLPCAVFTPGDYLSFTFTSSTTQTVFSRVVVTTGGGYKRLLLGNTLGQDVDLKGTGDGVTLYSGSILRADFTTSSPFTLTALFNGSSSGIYKNGALQGSTGDPGSLTSTAFTISDNTYGQGMDGSLGELLIYSAALGSGDRAAIETIVTP
jgi:hypothetical protein